MCHLTIGHCPCASCANRQDVGALQRIDFCRQRQAEMTAAATTNWSRWAPGHDLAHEILPCGALTFSRVPDAEVECASSPKSFDGAGEEDATGDAQGAAGGEEQQVAGAAVVGSAAAAGSSSLSAAGVGDGAAAATNTSGRPKLPKLPSGRTPLPTSRPDTPAVAAALAAAAAANRPRGGSGEWVHEEKIKLLALRARGVDFEEISRHLPGRDAAACRAMFDTLAEKHGYAGQI